MGDLRARRTGFLKDDCLRIVCTLLSAFFISPAVYIYESKRERELDEFEHCLVPVRLIRWSVMS